MKKIKDPTTIEEALGQIQETFNRSVKLILPKLKGMYTSLDATIDNVFAGKIQGALPETVELLKQLQPLIKDTIQLLESPSSMDFIELSNKIKEMDKIINKEN